MFGLFEIIIIIALIVFTIGFFIGLFYFGTQLIRLTNGRQKMINSIRKRISAAGGSDTAITQSNILHNDRRTFIVEFKDAAENWHSTTVEIFLKNHEQQWSTAPEKLMML